MNSMYWKWLTSRTVRQAVDLRNQVRKFLNAQRDILTPQAIDALETGLASMQAVLDAKPDQKVIESQMTNLETVANKWLKAYPSASIRENIEVVLVAVAVALGIRTFFLQPFKIPTGSMQPTLYGITHQDLRNDPTVKLPNGFGKFIDSWFYGISYYQVVAKAEGRLEEVERVTRLLPLVTKQRLRVGNVWYTIWFPPDELERRANLRTGQLFYKGDDIVKLMVKSGDHLFVDRFTFNFRRPTRGEIIVFKTQGINTLPQDQYYIKRLVALGGERVRIGNDHHLVINDRRLDAATPRFENVYTFNSNPQPYQYFGHANGYVGQQFTPNELAPLFPDEKAEFRVAKDHYLVMGDNTLNSRDSREWGDFPQGNVIGKSAFVYWPISSRFGWSHR